MADLTKQQALDLIEQLAQEWDGFECDVAAVGMVDIGDAIRRSGFAKVNAALGVVPSSNDQQEGHDGR
jgi:hypothetical protein